MRHVIIDLRQIHIKLKCTQLLQCITVELIHQNEQKTETCNRHNVKLQHVAIDLEQINKKLGQSDVSLIPQIPQIELKT